MASFRDWIRVETLRRLVPDGAVESGKLPRDPGVRKTSDQAAMRARVAWRRCCVFVAATAGLFPVLAWGDAKKPAAPRPSTPTSETLPTPEISKSPLLRLLQRRHTAREFGPRELDPQQISNLLWAAYGINRPQSGHRTAPSAHNWQNIDVYVANSRGLFRYDAVAPKLELVRPGDIRPLTGDQGFAATAPLTLIYVSDRRKGDRGLPAEMATMFESVTVGAIAQNVYLYSAEMGWNTGVRADMPRDKLHRAMGLDPAQRIVLAQSAGLPD